MTSGRTKFQFHKVRLKEYARKRKSLSDTFQFHKVRLKEDNTNEYYRLPKFQFHKVRLKASMMLIIACFIRFNSIRYD